jgi:ribonucleotide reductase beta subunit family protein with ferritin-like domain
VSLPWINAKIKHMMNLRLKLLRNAKQTNNPATWTNYRRLINQITADIREAKCQYYQKLFDEVHD